MSHANDAAGRADALSVSDLFTRYLERQIDAHAQGLGFAESDDAATPYDTAPVQPVDPQLAWNDALAAGYLLGAPKGSWSVPPEWPILVSQQEPALALPFCLGNFPQMVRHLHALLSAEPLALRHTELRRIEAPALVEWASRAQPEPGRYLAAAALRLAGHLERAEQALLAEPTPAFQVLHGNEMAALAWHRGQHEKALAGWLSLPDSVPVLFNRGMAALFLGKRGAALVALDAEVAHLPETCAWHHLGSLYRTLASAG